MKFFGIYGGYERDEYSRDFVYLKDMVAVNFWFVKNLGRSFIVNVSTGQVQPLNDVAVDAINSLSAERGVTPQSLAEIDEAVVVENIDCPDSLSGKYECATKTDLKPVRRAVSNHKIESVTDGVAQYASRMLQVV